MKNEFFWNNERKRYTKAQQDMSEEEVIEILGKHTQKDSFI